MSPRPAIPCPQCSKPMTFGAAACRACAPPAGGRKPGVDALYAAELGVRRRRVMKVGGAAKLRALSPEARSVLLRIPQAERVA